MSLYSLLYTFINIPKTNQPPVLFVVSLRFFFPYKRRTRNVPQVQSFDPHDGTIATTETDGGTTGWTLEASEVTTAVQSWVLLCHLVVQRWSCQGRWFKKWTPYKWVK